MLIINNYVENMLNSNLKYPQYCQSNQAPIAIIVCYMLHCLQPQLDKLNHL